MRRRSVIRELYLMCSVHVRVLDSVWVDVILQAGIAGVQLSQSKAGNSLRFLLFFKPQLLYVFCGL